MSIFATLLAISFMNYFYFRIKSHLIPNALISMNDSLLFKQSFYCISVVSSFRLLGIFDR